MPLSRRELIQLSVILLIVPVQYYLTNQYSPALTSRSQILADIVSNLRRAQSFATNTLGLSSLAKLCNLVRSWAFNDIHHRGGSNEAGESPAKEVLEYRNQQMQGYFTSSTEPRYIRPHGLSYHIGQIVKHTTAGYRAVIIGWDPQARAPERWLREMDQSDEKLRKQPNYLVMVDIRDRTQPQFTYVPQEHLEPFPKNRIMHPKLDDYFESYDGAQYVPRPWLQSLYPRD